jgi:hypothetical protein
MKTGEVRPVEKLKAVQRGRKISNLTVLLLLSSVVTAAAQTSSFSKLNIPCFKSLNVQLSTFNLLVNERVPGAVPFRSFAPEVGEEKETRGTNVATEANCYRFPRIAP